MKSTKKIALLGMGIALYVVLGMTLNIPLIAHIKTDLGYIAFGFMLYYLGWQAFVVGVIGCFLESLIMSGWVPFGWMLGQAFIGITCGITYKKIKFTWVNIIITILTVFIGVALIKTGIECVLYDIPFIIKFPKNLIAFIADTIPMIVGYVLAKTTKIKFLTDTKGE